MTIQVHTHISGSPCVVQLREDWELYIDTERRSLTSEKIEIVSKGHVCHREYRHPQDAPGRIVDIMRQLKRGVAPGALT